MLKVPCHLIGTREYICTAVYYKLLYTPLRQVYLHQSLQPSSLSIVGRPCPCSDLLLHFFVLVILAPFFPLPGTENRVATRHLLVWTGWRLLQLKWSSRSPLSLSTFWSLRSLQSFCLLFWLDRKQYRKFPGQFHATLNRDESKLGQKARKNEISSKFQITNYQASNEKNYSFQLTIDTSKKVIAQHYVFSSYLHIYALKITILQ